MEELTPTLRHELRTPLNHPIAYGEMTIESLTDDEGAAANPATGVLREMAARSRKQAQALQTARDPA